MGLDKSSTHQKVVKNGEEGWIIKEVWETMRSKGKTNGFSAVANTPPEVELLKQKVKETPSDPSDPSAPPEVVDPALTGENSPKAKPTGKAK